MNVKANRPNNINTNNIFNYIHHGAFRVKSACEGFLIPGFVSVLRRQPARRAPVKRGTVFAGSGGSVLEAANWSKLSEACESSCLSR